MSSGFSNEAVGGVTLVRPAIQSPNFSQAGQTGWAILANGSAFFFNITATGTVNASGGITVGEPPGSEITLNPNANQAFDVTTAIAGFLQAVGQFITTDASEVVAGALGSLLLGTGTATKMSTALTSAFGTSGAAILLESQNDAGTDTPVITFGTVATPDAGTTLVYSPIATLTPYAFLLYSGVSGQTVVTKTSGSGTIPIPAGVTTAKAECWGGGGGGGDGGFAGAGGEYAAEPALAVTGGGTVAYSVGAAGAGAPANTINGTAGGASTMTGTSVTVTAHGGQAGQTGTGGTGSADTVHYNGGAGFIGSIGFGGCGGAGSGGTASAGNPGVESFALPGAAGALAVTGGGPGGAGGNGSTGNTGATSGKAPVSGPGGGGGGTGYNEGSNTWPASGNGFAGQVRLTYSSGVVPPILFSVASAGGTDQFGTAWQSGMFFQSAAGGANVFGTAVAADTVNRFEVDSNGKHTWGPGTGARDTDLYRAAAGVLETDGSLIIGTPAATLSTDATGYPTVTDKAGLALHVSGSALSAVNTATVNATGVTSLGFLAIPASDVETGCAYQIHASGSFSTGTTPSSATFSVYWGGIAGTLLTSLAVPTITAGLGGASWFVDSEVSWTSTTASEVTLRVGWHTGGGVIGSVSWFVVSVATGLTTTLAENLTLAFAWGSVPGTTSLTCDVVRIGRVA